MKITVLVENNIDQSQQSKLKAQHGLSLYIELDNMKILFDTGKNDLFYKNAKILGINLSKVDYLVLSHAHYDHIGGVTKFLQINKHAKIIVSEDISSDTYSKRLGFYKFIGLDSELFKKNKNRFLYVENESKLNEKLFFIKNSSIKQELLKANSHLYKRVNNSYVLDDFSHEFIMIIIKNSKIDVITGCSHNGILNIVKTVQDKFPLYKINTLIGGFHLQNSITKKLSEPKDKVIKIGEKFIDIPHIYTDHCTGHEGFNLLKEVLGDKISEFKTGTILKI